MASPALSVLADGIAATFASMAPMQNSVDTPPPILEARDLIVEFRGVRAVNKVNLSVREGDIHALIGPNGAGKTTCFNTLTRYIRATSGSIHFAGVDISHERPAKVARMGLVRSFQISAVFPHMSVLENVRLARSRRFNRSFHFWRAEAGLAELNDEVRGLLDQVGLLPWQDSLAVELPYGRKRVLEIVTTLALEPRLMLLDEPTQGMAFEEVETIMDLIRTAAKGRTVLMVEHNMKVVAGICNRITVLARGSVLAEGDYAEIAAHPQVIEAYMGHSAQVAT